jgi:chemotaxis signal transduction protein
MPQTGGVISDAKAAALMAERTARLAARERRVAAAPRRHLIVCSLGREFYGIDIAACGGVMPFGGAVSISGGHPAILGLVSRHGRTAGVVDLGRILGLTAGAEAETGHLIMLRRERGLALLVDRVHGAFHLPLASADLGSRPRAETEGVTAYAMAPARTLGDDEAVVAVLDLAQLLKPVQLQSGA